ncbi:SDR family NAD(P)-dependent oxidoreductase [Nocardioides nitrophenolicus]|uniref:SDR family NAD(P)-dependent oxidoreductase n=1 Tax=Nocardioides nitrophenolicus TaxID=60489 RepID=UPI0019563983|nr:SDR family oxidoreductase [Nocardioides nitrophenolicus]MBM7517944.1 NAD(P)-dependent dehydrogenase (short-subunit alcohol dehydrogenase family) [Nocardioides nitrophenolicus]
MSAVTDRFGGGVAVVTGAGSGLGEAMALHLAGAGVHVVVTDVDRERATAVATACVAAGKSAEAHHLDVADGEQVDALFATVWATHGSVDLVVSNAGIESGERLWDLTPAQWRRVQAVNTDGAFHCARSAVPRMGAQERPGVLAVVASTGAVTSLPYQSAYVTSKHAALALVECLDLEVRAAELPVQVSALLPNWVRTRIFDDVRRAGVPTDPDARASFLRMAESIQAQGMAPPEAAERLLDAVARGEFWCFTDPDRTARLFDERARTLLDLRRPERPGWSVATA